MKNEIQKLNKKRINELVIVRNFIDFIVEIGKNESIKDCCFNYDDVELGIHINIEF